MALEFEVPRLAARPEYAAPMSPPSPAPSPRDEIATALRTPSIGIPRMANLADAALAEQDLLVAEAYARTLLALSVNTNRCSAEHHDLVLWLAQTREHGEASLVFLERFAASAGCPDIAEAVAQRRRPATR